MIKELTCIQCPLGCALQVELDDSGSVLSVSGNACKRGELYGKKEVTNPTRTITSTVKIIGGAYPVLPVRSKTDIPKDKLFDCLDEIKQAVITAPVKIGDIIIQNVAGTGVDIIATAPAPKIQDRD